MKVEHGISQPTGKLLHLLLNTTGHRSVAWLSRRSKTISTKLGGIWWWHWKASDRPYLALNSHSDKEYVRMEKILRHHPKGRSLNMTTAQATACCHQMVWESWLLLLVSWTRIHLYAARRYGRKETLIDLTIRSSYAPIVCPGSQNNRREEKEKLFSSVRSHCSKASA